MIDSLAAVVAVVDDDAVAFCESLGACNLCRDPEQVAEESNVVLGAVGEGNDVFAGGDQHVHGRLRMDVGKGITELVLVDGGGRDGSFNDFAKDAAHHGTSVQERRVTP